MPDGNYDTLLVSRQVDNGSEIIEWARNIGFDSTLDNWDLHVTIAFSKSPLIGTSLEPIRENLMIEGGQRQLLELGPEGEARVLAFESSRLQQRWGEIIEAGASWDFPSFIPHITLTNLPSDVDLAKVKPYAGRIILDGEWFTEISPKFIKSNSHLPWLLGGGYQVSEDVQVMKVDATLGIVFGWAIISKINGEDYFDLEGDHITETAMLKAAADFMEKSRIVGDMHVELEGGVILFAWPLTDDISKAMGIKSLQTGLMIGMKPKKKETLQKFIDGIYTGFSIGGRIFEMEKV